VNAFRVFPEQGGGDVIDPATTSSLTPEYHEVRSRALSKFDHRGAGSRGVGLGELPFTSQALMAHKANPPTHPSCHKTLPQNSNFQTSQGAQSLQRFGQSRFQQPGVRTCELWHLAQRETSAPACEVTLVTREYTHP
jgi:hypothetical protein